MMKTKQTVALAATMSVALLLANTGYVFADSGNAEFKSSTIEEKWTKKSFRDVYTQVFDVCVGDNPIIKHEIIDIWSDKETKSLKTDRISPNMCRMMAVQIAAEDPDSIKMELRGFGEKVQNEDKSVTPVKNSASDDSSVNLIQAHNARSGQPFETETKRVIYKVTSGDTSIKDGKIFITASDAYMNKDVKNLFANKSTVHQVFMKVADTNSIDVKLHR